MAAVSVKRAIEQLIKRLLPSFFIGLINFSWIKGGNIAALGRLYRIGLQPAGIKEYTNKVKKET